MQRKLGLRQSALVSVIRGEEFDSVFAESALVHFTAPGHIDDVLRDFFAHGIGVGRPGELTAGLLNLLPSIVECHGNDFDSLRIENDRRTWELHDLRHGDPSVQAGAVAVGDSSIRFVPVWNCAKRLTFRQRRADRLLQELARVGAPL